MLVSGLLSTVCLPAQPRAGEEDLRTGLGLFKQEEYQKALVSFAIIISDPASSVYAPDAYFWSAKAYLALNQLEDAERSLEYYLANYSGHPYYGEAQYQKGRLLYLKRDYEGAIRTCQEFIRYYPRSELVPNALFWIGDSLYLLGKLEEAARVFNKVLQEHPQSFKVEATRYRLSLIDFKKRENELMRLLKWSHEELLKATDEFQRREKVYEQAIGTSQKTPGGTSREGETGPGDALKLIEELRAENTALKTQLQNQQAQSSAKLEELQAENDTLKTQLQSLQAQSSTRLEELQAENDTLKTQLQSQQSQSTARLAELQAEIDNLKSQLQSQQAQATARLAELDKLAHALKIKAEALNLKESLLLRYEETQRKD
jgi:TolA-binding protein